MGKCEPYPEEFKRDLVKRYLQSGLNRYQFCHLPDVTVSEISIRRWLRELEAEATGGGEPAVDDGSPGELNIACYTIGATGGAQPVPGAGWQERGPSLAEMVAFHADVQECCTRLYRLACTQEGAALVARMLEAL
jgi:hypothetical protein